MALDILPMPPIPTKFHTRRISLFLVLAFGLSWLVGAYIYLSGGLSGSARGSAAALSGLLVAYMFGPGIAHLLVRTLTDTRLDREATWLNPHLRARFRWYAIAWFLPAVLVMIGVTIFYALFPQHFDRSMEAMWGTLDGQVPTGISPMAIAAGQLVAALTIGPAVNTVVAFGEEFGWRGFLLQHLYPLGRRAAVVLTGVIWGVWHWPIIAMGYNYGTGYPGAPWLGMLAMVWLTVLLGTFLAWVTLRAGSVWPAAVGHGAFNAVAAYGILFVRGEPNPLLGPMGTGVVVSLPMLALAAFLLWKPTAFDPPAREA